MGATSLADLSKENSLTHAAAPDFSGYATKSGLKCSDGRTITPDAFKHQDKMTVPLVWQHTHDDPANVLGHVSLEHRADGVYAYAYFNDSDGAKNAKLAVQHEDIKSLSIFANKLVEKAGNVLHGFIREVSLVLAGANPGALIDNIALQHGDGGDTVILEDEAIIYTGLEITHDIVDEEEATETDAEKNDEEAADEADPTLQNVYDSMSPEQKDVVHFMVGKALDGATATHTNEDADGVSSNGKEGRRMSRNVFEEQAKGKKGEKDEKHTLSHDDMRGIVTDAERCGSLKEAVENYALQHGIENIEVLFPEVRNVNATPEFNARRMAWVAPVLNSIRKSPFTRIKSIVADITMDEARARGYIKGELKKEEWFSVTKRTTTPSTIYKKQKLDRDDIVDIVDFDVVLWIKAEMRMMLDEEIARAVLIGDGRAIDDEDKIKDPSAATDGAGIRSILNEHDLYAARVNVNVDGNFKSTALVDQILENMRFYKGTGTPTFYTTLPILSQMLLARDTVGRRYYRTASDLAAELGVDSVVAVEAMEHEASVNGLIGIVVNLVDYTLGADKGGEVSLFDFFDIDYNQYKYLIETRLSGALTKIRSALVIVEEPGDPALVVPVSPTFDDETGIITPATTTGVTYKRADTNATVTTGAPITLTEGQTLKIYAVPASSSYYFDNNVEDQWTLEMLG